MAKKNLIILGELKAQCACGGWHYQGVIHEAVKAIEKVYDAHLWSCPLKKSATSPTTKKRRKIARS